MSVKTGEDQTPKTSAGRGRSKNGEQSAYGIRKLRELILTLATRGSLVPQNYEEGSAITLLQDANKIKEQLYKNGLIKKVQMNDGNLEPYPQEDLPDNWIQIPVNWLGVYNENTSITPNQQPTQIFELWSVPSYHTGKPEILSGSEIGSNKIIVKEDDILLSKINPRLKRTWVVEKAKELPQIASTEWIRISETTVFRKFLVYLFTENSFIKKMCREQTGMGSLTRARPKDVANILVKLPPIAEQIQIVSKVDELMALCDKLEQQQTDSIAAHQTLVETLLGTLTASANNQELQGNWSRVEKHFDSLF